MGTAAWVAKVEFYKVKIVSIQLISPASGDDKASFECAVCFAVSIQLISPASGDKLYHYIYVYFINQFPFN